MHMRMHMLVRIIVPGTRFCIVLWTIFQALICCVLLGVSQQCAQYDARHSALCAAHFWDTQARNHTRIIMRHSVRQLMPHIVGVTTVCTP